jgi:hypothetical protein
MFVKMQRFFIKYFKFSTSELLAPVRIFFLNLLEQRFLSEFLLAVPL